FKLAKTLAGLLLVALIFSISFLLFLESWLSAFVGLVLALVFVQLLATTTALLGQIVAEHAYNARRRIVLLMIGAMAAAAVVQMLWNTEALAPAELAHRFRSSWFGVVLLAPFEIFARAILAPNWFPELVCWGAASLAIDAGLLALIFKLDADYLESAAVI